MPQGGGFFLLSRTRQIVWEKVDKTTTTKKNCRRKATTPGNTYRKSSIKPPGLIYYPPGLFISNTFEGEGAYLRRRLIRGFTVCLQTLKASWTVSGHESEMVVVHDRFLECFNHWYFAWVLFVGGGSFFSEGGHT